MIEIDIPGRSKPVMAWYSVATPDLFFILSYLKPGVDFALQADHPDYAFPTQNLDQMPTEAEVVAIVDEERLDRSQRELKQAATLHGLQYANTTDDPLTGAPISTASDANTIRQNTWTAEQYWKVADGLTQAEIDAQWPNANAHAHADIAAARALQDTLRGITLTIHAEIDAVTEQANLPSESDITTDPRWPTP